MFPRLLCVNISIIEKRTYERLKDGCRKEKLELWARGGFCMFMVLRGSGGRAGFHSLQLGSTSLSGLFVVEQATALIVARVLGSATLVHMRHVQRDDHMKTTPEGDSCYY